MGYLLKCMKRRWSILVMLLPFFILFFMFTVLPVIRSIGYSFTYYNIFNEPKFIWFDNFTRLFMDDPIFMTALKNTLIFAAITGPTGYLLSLMIAWLINDLGPKVRWFLTLVFYAPAISGSAVTVFSFIFSADRNGYVNSLLMSLGFITEPIAWLKDPTYILGTLIVVQIWMSLGTSFLAFIAGLQGVDRSLYEAGAVEGIRNKWQELWYITLPSMRPQLMFGAIMSITGSFGFGGVVTALCGFPSVDYAAHTIIHHLEDYGTQRYEIGYSSAIAVILFVIMIGANVIVNKILSKVGT